ncbi:MAG: glucoamylase [Porticoccaceae bacterium]|nr:MAG: glucoamylase [Porticoccaceae bacterium]
MSGRDLELGVVGNCAYAALIDRRGEVVWCCLPRFDSDPLFSALLQGENPGPDGVFAIELVDFHHSEQRYEKNTAILVTRLVDRHGNALELTDFAPRFVHYGRIHRPLTLMRKLVPRGAPRVRIRLRPAARRGTGRCATTRGSNHLRYLTEEGAWRVTTTLPLSALVDEIPLVVDRDHYLIFGADEPVTEAVPHLVERFLVETRDYWRDWSRALAIPFEWQEAVIRAAITLKLAAYEDTGAIVAALTTSIPEAPHSGRNWDYRYCWLRDSYFTVHALNRLGATKTMEQYLQYLVNLIAGLGEGHLQPVYRIDGTPHLPEEIVPELAGYRGMGPVRFGNQAAEQIQHDVYGAVVLSATQMFFDERIHRQGDRALFALLERAGERARDHFNKPDAGLWELRNSRHVHTFSSIMCWAAADRLARIAARLELAERASYWREVATGIRRAVLARGYSERLGSLTATWDGETLDASLLLAAELGFLRPDDPRFLGTLARIERELKPDGSPYLFRYLVPDDFGTPEVAFTICTFWYIDALAAVGRRDEARALFEDLLARRNHLGLLSEDLDPRSGELWGNFPQTYSMVGIINSARLLSIPWEAAL